MSRRIFSGRFQSASMIRGARQATSRKKIGPLAFALGTAAVLLEIGIVGSIATLIFRNEFGSSPSSRPLLFRRQSEGVYDACRAESNRLNKCLDQCGNNFSNCHRYMYSMQKCRKLKCVD